MTAETIKIKERLKTLIDLNKMGISVEQLAILCGVRDWKLRRFMLQVGYVPPRKKTGPKEGNAPKEVRRCGCLESCTLTFSSSPKSTKKYINPQHAAIAKSRLTSGSAASNWQGGLTPLHTEIRSLLEMRNWRKQVFERDDYICQECKQRGCKLEAHHIKPFTLLFKEFLQYYSQFSPIEDKETLTRLAITWAPFWDTTNGKTLCESCHAKPGVHKWRAVND